MSYYLLCNAFPKSGTNMILQMAGASYHVNDLHKGMGASERTFQEIGEDIMDACVQHHRLVGHVPYSDGILGLCKSLGIKMVLLMRHPGDVIVSHAEHVKNYKDTGHNFIIDGTPLSERKDPISDLMDSIVERYWKILRWKYAKNYPVLYLTYAEIRRKPLEASKRMREFAPNVFKYEPLSLMVSRIDPHASPTFREGRIGEWKNIFNKRQRKKFDNLDGMPDLLKALGMEEV